MTLFENTRAAQTVRIAADNVIFGQQNKPSQDMALVKVPLSLARALVPMALTRVSGVGFSPTLLTVSETLGLREETVKVLSYDGFGEQSYLPVRRQPGFAGNAVPGSVVVEDAGADNVSAFALVAAVSNMDSSLLYILPLVRLEEFLSTAMHPAKPRFSQRRDGQIAIESRQFIGRADVSSGACGAVSGEVVMAIPVLEDDTVVTANAHVVPRSAIHFSAAKVLRIVTGKVHVWYELAAVPTITIRGGGGIFGSPVPEIRCRAEAAIEAVVQVDRRISRVQ
jgi:hypothetical protein